MNSTLTHAFGHGAVIVLAHILLAGSVICYIILLFWALIRAILHGPLLQLMLTFQALVGLHPLDAIIDRLQNHKVCVSREGELRLRNLKAKEREWMATIVGYLIGASLSVRGVLRMDVIPQLLSCAAASLYQEQLEKQNWRSAVEDDVKSQQQRRKGIARSIV